MYDISLHNLLGKGPTDEDKIDFNKFYSNIKKKINANKTIKKCELCGTENIKFCNSHTIPQFVLENISKNGYLYNSQALNITPLIKEENGLKSTQIFHSICTSCDNTLFQDYENNSNYNKAPTQIMLKQIALKNYLFHKYKLQNDIALMIEAKNIGDEMPEEAPTSLKVHYKNEQCGIDNLLKARKLDLFHNSDELKKVYKSLNNREELFKLCYFQKLEYTVPIALQGNSVIYYGFNNRQLNHPFAKNNKGLVDLHIGIFPFDNFSIVIIFSYKNSDKYNHFFDNLLRYNLSTQLSIINFIIFAYFEDIFLNKNLEKNILNDNNLQVLSQMQTDIVIKLPIYTDTKNVKDKNILKKQIAIYKENFNLDKHYTIPNLLDEKYSLQN
ncbi:MAG: hypothetical protein ACD_20C00212G0006 [uncultured bacterium]|nr:MAG: hypothetical protein ACD_20C00212G0006 [uncultured bacterium]